eukprot:TRINITY_DN3281_c0_g1_i1.p1 TRINITY_DN3281_c0_g1~~TRINITY_DN3281_c0_g1_i1.p1  ORF type:complete len:310 (+),score=61.13 TRINITY_DN3281_c0_g1_i1:198-1127(+)
MEDALKSIQDTALKFRNEVLAKEVECECSPLEAEFSKKLIQMIQQEEHAIKMENWDLKKRLAKAVDELLATETAAALRYICSETHKKFVGLHNKQVKAREQFKGKLERNLGIKLKTDMKIEDKYGEAGLVAKIGAKWAENEEFNFKTAFQRQMERIEAEWSSHFTRLETEYGQARERLGFAPVTNTGMGTGTGKGIKWHDKVKQEQLIHTAPVLAPIGVDGAFGRKKPSKSKQAELKRIEAQYARVRERLESQKEDALRFVRRQMSRMATHLSVEKPFRQQRTAWKRESEIFWKSLEKQVEELSAKQSK